MKQGYLLFLSLDMLSQSQSAFIDTLFCLETLLQQNTKTECIGIVLMIQQKCGWDALLSCIEQCAPCLSTKCALLLCTNNDSEEYIYQAMRCLWDIDSSCASCPIIEGNGYKDTVRTLCGLSHVSVLCVQMHNINKKIYRLLGPLNNILLDGCHQGKIIVSVSFALWNRSKSKCIDYISRIKQQDAEERHEYVGYASHNPELPSTYSLFLEREWITKNAPFKTILDSHGVSVVIVL